MAVTPFSRKPPGTPEAETKEEEKLRKEMDKLVTLAERDRNRHLTRIHDCYKYALPWRHRANQSQPQDQLDEIFDETSQTVLEDFAADMLNTFTPQKNDWIELTPPRRLGTAEQRMIAEAAAELQSYVFYEMARSNLYQALQESYLDLGVGTMVLLITDIDPTQPIHCEAIPSTDALIIRGPFGFISGTFRKKKYLRPDAEVLWPGADFKKTGPEPQDKATQELEITDGCWRDWSEKGSETYKYVVQCNSRIVYQKVWSGAGSCPFIVARWSRDPTTAWGVGPTYRTLPANKTLQHVRYLDLKNYDKHVDPVVTYEDDGVMNIDAGLVPGTWAPRAVGSQPPEVIESKAKFDVAVFERDELRSIIKRAHYQDRPEQLGKTPPTATQWADERAERARRMGTPATNLVEELQYPIIRRFMYLLSERGVLPKVILGEEVLTMQPISPLLRAQEQEEILRMDRFAEMLSVRLGPQLTPILIDIIPWVEKLAEKFGIDKGLIRDKAKMEMAIKQLLPILQNFTAGRPGEIAAPPVGSIGGPVG